MKTKIGLGWKSQITNTKSQTNHNNQISKFKTILGFENWDLGFVWKLEIGIWNFLPELMSIIQSPDHRILALVSQSYFRD